MSKNGGFIFGEKQLPNNTQSKCQVIGKSAQKIGFGKIGGRKVIDVYTIVNYFSWLFFKMGITGLGTPDFHFNMIFCKN
ncbi:hypothetical protein ES708_17004 [subsurface metagenome]